MIGNAEARPGERGQEPDLIDKLADVAGEPGHLRGALGIATVAGEQMAIVLDHGAAAGRGGENGIKRAFAQPARPGIDIAARGLMRLVLAAELLLKPATAGLLGGHHHLDAMTPEQPDRGAVDGGLQHLLHAAEQEGHALDRRLGGVDHRLALAELRMRPVGGHECQRRSAGLEAEAWPRGRGTGVRAQPNRSAKRKRPGLGSTLASSQRVARCAGERPLCSIRTRARSTRCI